MIDKKMYQEGLRFGLWHGDRTDRVCFDASIGDATFTVWMTGGKFEEFHRFVEDFWMEVKREEKGKEAVGHEV